ncbi:MAG: LacI family DNA-binding transcriptional regulator [Lachnospiraceae bacterium]|nr:LacI family DNA-binding transcriptional regulator [Lachnospiraceae bacterium]
MSLKEIAKKAGVSPATASRALNDPDYRCRSEEIRNRIWEAARELHYVPNLAAKNLKTLRSEEQQQVFHLNILITRTDGARTDPFFDELLRSLEGEFHRRFCILNNIWHKSEFSDERKCRGMNLQKEIDLLFSEVGEQNDGLLIIGKCALPVLSMLQKKCQSIVSINRNSTNYAVDEVLCDGEKIAGAATEYLISLGHTEIGYIGSCHHESRYRGFLDALARHSLEVDPGYIIETRQTEAEGFKAMQTLAESGICPTALFCANDISAIGVLKYLSLMKKKAPAVAVISCDDIAEAEVIRPALTTFHLDKKEMARHAVYLLLDRIEGGHINVARIEVESRLIERESCFAP